MRIRAWSSDVCSSGPGGRGKCCSGFARTVLAGSERPGPSTENGAYAELARVDDPRPSISLGSNSRVVASPFSAADPACARRLRSTHHAFLLRLRIYRRSNIRLCGGVVGGSYLGASESSNRPSKLFPLLAFLRCNRGDR